MTGPEAAEDAWEGAGEAGAARARRPRLGQLAPLPGLGTYLNPMGDSATPKDFRGSRCPSTKCLLRSPVIEAHKPLLQEAARTGSLTQPTSPLQKN